MYGGHIVEDWDRRLASAYLHKYFSASLFEGIQLFPGFDLPPPTMTHAQVQRYIACISTRVVISCLSVCHPPACMLSAAWPSAQLPAACLHPLGSRIHRGWDAR